MDELISRHDLDFAFTMLRFNDDGTLRHWGNRDQWCLSGEEVEGLINSIPPAEPRWIPVNARPMDTEERLEWSEKLGYDIEYNEALIYTSVLPDDGQEVLTCDRYGNVRIDTFANDPDYGCYFEENGDMEGIFAWMPLPEPWKVGEE